MSGTLTGTFSADGSTTGVKLQGFGVLILGGTFGGGTVSLEVQGSDGSWYASSDTYSAPDVDNIKLEQPVIARLTLAGATSPSLYYEIRY
jgi:hypothetical protein